MGGEIQRIYFDILSQNTILLSPPRLFSAFDLNSQIALALLEVWFSAKSSLLIHQIMLLRSTQEGAHRMLGSAKTSQGF